MGQDDEQSDGEIPEAVSEITQELVDEAEQLFTDLTRTYRQVLGRQHPDTRGAEGDLETFLTWKAKSPFR